jgi:hypothetical protein
MTRKARTISPDNQLLLKAIDQLMADIIRDSTAMVEAQKRLSELSDIYNVHSEYLNGYLWGQLVVHAQLSQSRPGRN